MLRWLFHHRFQDGTGNPETVLLRYKRICGTGHEDPKLSAGLSRPRPFLDVLAQVSVSRVQSRVEKSAPELVARNKGIVLNVTPDTAQGVSERATSVGLK